MKIGGFLVLFIIIVLGALAAVLGILGDWIWFAAVGYETAFVTMLFTSIALGVLFGAGFLFFAMLNVWLARRMSPKKARKKRGLGVFAALSLIIAFMVGAAFSGWEVVLRFLNPTGFGIADPVFGLDVGFYTFTLPFYGTVFAYLVSLIIPTMFLVWGAHMYYSWMPGAPRKDEMDEEGRRVSFSDVMSKNSSMHLSVLAGLLFLVVAFGFYLAQFSLLFSETGVVFGAGYTDLNVILPLMQVMMLLSVIVGLVFIAGSRSGRGRPRMLGLVAFFAILVLGIAASGVTQGFIVSPNEFNMETPYIERNIQNTLDAYGLDTVDESIFRISYNLTGRDIESNPGTIGNIRLWDWRPLITTYNQLQLFRTYYDFNDVDIDRYRIDGGYKQVMVSAREMNTRNLPENAQTWVNQHLVYTHGYGVVMNPVDKVSAEGLPEFYVKDIPPESVYFSITRPEIYYGESTSSYAIVDTTTDELDYPSGEQNAYTTYGGSGGVGLSDFARRLIYAVRYGSIELLVSGSIKPETRILMHRDVRSRMDTIAPFLLYDGDPYIVISDGRLYWMADAYTITNTYPYSEPIYTTSGLAFNYIRNSVKVVVDAYNGDVSYYVIDSSDPMISTYMKIFPGMFRDFSEMPEGLKDHVRYPEDLFRIQAELYSDYHMGDPMVFYNKEDAWVIPDEIYRGNRQEIIPYYVIMKLPGEEKEEFIMMIPFTPGGKENLVGWMAAKSDFPGYGNLTVFQFSKQELTFGPMQIEARIDQDTEISQKITLWSQSGSSVIRGNTLIIPIENSILYIEPLYLEATEKGTLPELKRVIVAYGNRISMKETLKDALEDIFGGITAPPSGDGGAPPSALADSEKLQRISDLYNMAQDALMAGNLGGYQDYVDQIGELLK
jgi:uncharacterized membrane protein (UPF0182 family)